MALPASLPTEQPDNPGLHPRIARIDDRFITAEVDGSKYGAQALDSMRCHMTQWAPLERIDGMFESFTAATEGKVFFREMGKTLAAGGTRESTLLADSP